MKIAFLIKNLNCGGAENTAVSLANSFVNDGNEVCIVTVEGGDCFYPIDKKVRIIPANNAQIDLNTSAKRLFGAIGRMLTLRRIVKNEKPDILIGMSFAMTWYAVAITALTKIKAIGTERSNPYKYKATAVNTFLRKFFYRLTDGYVFQTRKASHFFTNKLRKTDTVIPNAVGNKLVYALEPPTQRKKIICSVGRLDKAKRFDVLIDAFDMIAEKIPEYKLVIYGEGSERKNLTDKIKLLRSSDRIELPGANPEAVKFVNESSVFVLSSEYEGMPNALIEAMTLGVPCVSTRCEMGPDELITQSENGLLTEVNDTKGIAEAILKIIDNPEFAERISKNSAKIKQSHSMENICKIWLDFLKSI